MGEDDWKMWHHAFGEAEFKPKDRYSSNYSIVISYKFKDPDVICFGINVRN